MGAQITGVRGLDLAPGLVVELLLLQGLDLSLGKDDTFFGDLGLQGFQTQFEVGQVMAKPDAAHRAGRDEHTALAQLVADTDLAMGRAFNSVIDNRVFRFKIDPVLPVGNPVPMSNRSWLNGPNRITAVGAKGGTWRLLEVDSEKLVPYKSIKPI